MPANPSRERIARARLRLARECGHDGPCALAFARVHGPSVWRRCTCDVLWWRRTLGTFGLRFTVHTGRSA